MSVPHMPARLTRTRTSRKEAYVLCENDIDSTLSQAGSVTNMRGTMSGMRMCFALDLKDDPALIEEYQRYHAPGGPPAAVTRSLRKSGIESLEIYLCGNRLFMILEGGPTFSLQAKAQADEGDADVQRWEALMWRFQQPLPWSAPGEKWVRAEKIYDLSEQADDGA
jgi:L-rhamnose mutarotase